MNETQGEGIGPKSDAIYEFAKGLRARGVPISGVGLQMHWWARGSPANISGAPSPADVAANMKRLADLGLQVYITEMDAPVREPATPEKLAAQAQTYRDMLEVCLAASNCKALIVWGIYDGNSAAQDPRFPSYAAPLLFDEAFRPKPAYEALADVLRRR